MRPLGRRAAALSVVAVLALMGLVFFLDQRPPGRVHAVVSGVDVTLGLDDARVTLADATSFALRLRVLGAVVRPRLMAARREGDALVATLSWDGGRGSGALRISPARSGLQNTLRIDFDASAREVALGFSLATDGREVFLSDVGELAEVGEAKGALLVLGARAAFASADGALAITLSAAGHVGAPRIVDAFAPEGKASRGLLVAVAPAAQDLYGALWTALGRPVATVRGVVSGADATTRVLGLGADGHPRVRVPTGPGGRFSVDVPKEVNRWYAALGEGAVASPPVFFEPGATWDLRLDVAPAGELVVRVRDPDQLRPLVARVAVRGIDGTLDPNFGPDYRASGAGPLMDLLAGEVKTPLSSGRYRVSATKGIEWSIDSVDVTVESGGRVAVDLELRHVVPTAGQVGCDLHVHARPSFDTPVQVEDRVLSLVSAGVDFAVPTEHNLVGDYGPALRVLELSSSLAWVPGVEVTTYTPRFGHFGVFPWDPAAGVPPYRKTSPAALFAAVRKDPKRVLQVNHPRLPNDIGYFAVAGFDPKDKNTYSRVKTDFDALEVYSGYDLEHPARVDAVLADYYALLNTGRRIVATGSSDAHRIQYQWAGYPRTMVRVDDATIEPSRVVEALKRGRATVTSGPIVDLEVRGEGESAGTKPGDEHRVQGKRLVAGVSVYAAPWLDVAEIFLVADGVVASRVDLERRPGRTGREDGTLADAQARTLRYRGELAVPDGAKWVMAFARGQRKMDDVLAFMPVVPMAFTNPVWLRR